MVFSVTPEANVRVRVGRLVSAVAAGYVLANLALYWSHSMDWEAYQACQDRFPDGFRTIRPECEHLVNIADGASIVFYLLFGWIPAAAYTGFWELLWRWDHRHSIRQRERSFKGKWASNTVIFFFLLVVSYPIFATIILYIKHPEWF